MSSAHQESQVGAFMRAPLRSLPSALHWIFLLFAVPLVVFLAVRTPAFQSPDEVNHFYRSWQVAQGGLFARGGGYVDSGIEQLYASVQKLRFNSQAHIADAEVAVARAVPWSGRLTYQSFPNTAAYFPADYIPQAVAILIGRAIGISVLNTLILARLLNGAAAIAICAYSLAVCGRGKVAMFALLLLPMTLSLFASSSQDATLIALACLAFSLISRQLDATVPMTRTTTAVVFGALLLIAIGRPPNAALALAFFIPGLLPARSKTQEWLTALVLTGVTVATTLAWWIAVILATRGISQPYEAGSNVDPKMQLINLLHHPHIVVPMLGWILHHTTYYIAGVIGILGWLDTPMPALYYLAMMLVLAGAIFAELARGPAIPRGVTALIFFAALVGIAGVFFIEYLDYTPVGGTESYGTQGRHLIPLLVAAAAGLPCLVHSPKMYARATAIVVAAQLITVVVLPRVIMARYYAG
jgi:uncharacterized membrane protein